MVRRGFLIGGLMSALALSENGCSYSGQPSDPSTTIVSVQAVRVTPQVLQLHLIGETGQITATVVPANATDQTIVWESSDSTVATVDAAGLVTAKAVGSGVFITAYTHDGNHQASVNVTVNP